VCTGQQLSEFGTAIWSFAPTSQLQKVGDIGKASLL